MRALVPAFAIAFVGCSGTDASSPLDAPAPVVMTRVTRESMERDLGIEIHRTNQDAFELGHRPGFQIILTNHSTVQSYPVVLSNDGSTMGWREPHLFYTVERRDAATAPWTTAEDAHVLWCGMYAENWAKDVITLGPGQSVTLPWSELEDLLWELEGASHVRIVAHYVYGDHARDWAKVPPVLHGMPAYALASKPLELPIDPPMDLRLWVRGPISKHLQTWLDVAAVNHSKRTLPFAAADSGGILTLVFDDGEHHFSLRTGVGLGEATDRLAPGERRNALGSASVIDKIPEGSHPRRVRAFLEVYQSDDASRTVDERTLRSPWVNLE